MEKVNILLSPDKTWYGTFRFNGFKGFDEIEGFIETLKKTASDNGLKLSDKITAQQKADDTRLVVTFKDMATPSEAEDLIETLRKEAKKHSHKGQKALDEAE